ncbi:MAG: EAL domain-containing protein [Gammaproteobacteria bacterium]|nr:EAL domain-containing protein [Gammaproteobacteria bacterium]
MLSNLKEGDLVGEMALIDKLPRSATAVALEPTRAIAIPLDYIEIKIADSDPAIRLFLRYIMAKYRDMHTRFRKVFDGIEDLEESRVNSTLADTTAEFKNVIVQYQEMQQQLTSAVNMPDSVSGTRPVGDQTLFNTKLSVTQDKSIKSALQDEEFVLHFQPIVDLKTKSIAGCEALIRWQTADGSFVPPSEFIPRAETSGVIVDLGYWIAQQACAFQKRLAQKFSQSIFVSINLSGKQFDDPYLIDSLADIMVDTGIRHELIKFEITESLLMEHPELASSALNRLKKTGAKLAIDDFGTGYSSFSYLHQLPFDTLKIDQTFVSAMSSNLKSNEIIKSLVNLSHDLGMDVIAEGIETKFDLNMLRHHDTDYGQGYLFSKALPGDTLIRLITKRLARSQQT